MGEKERLDAIKEENPEEEHEPEIKRPIDPKRVLQILEFRRKTMDFVESMLEEDISIDSLKAGEKFLCRRDYDGIVQERYLIKLCGYPLCGNKLVKEWKQKFHVSFQDKKIYNVEIRKLYCCINCMNNSTKYRDKNLPQEPIWMRPSEAGILDKQFE